MSGVSLLSRTFQPGGGVVLAAVVVIVGAAGCGGAVAPDVSAAVTTPPGQQPGTTRPAPAEPVSFFRSLAPACRAHAKKTENPQVEAARFIRASLVDSLGGGAYLIRDGFGTRLVVRPADRIVLPATGKDTDEMPAPYGFGCPPELFKGTSH